VSASDPTMTRSATAAPSKAAAGLDRLVTLVSRREQGYGLSPAQWSAIRYIATRNAGEEATTGGFARLRLITPSSASQTVASLVRLGLVERRANADGRSRTLVLTPKARALIESDPHQHVVTALAGVSSKSLSEFTEVLELLLRALLP
jgi:DNA-binding MarR family transcriptional regulator